MLGPWLADADECRAPPTHAGDDGIRHSIKIRMQLCHQAMENAIASFTVLNYDRTRGGSPAAGVNSRKSPRISVPITGCGPAISQT